MMLEGRKLSPEVRRTQVGLLYRAPWRIITHFVIGVVFVAILWDELDRRYLVGWLSLISLVTAIRYALCLRFLRQPPNDRNPERYLRVFAIGSAVSGSLWGATAAVLWLTPSVAHHVFVAFVVSGTAAGGAATNIAHRPSSLIFLSTALVPVIVATLVHGGPLYAAISFVTCLYLLFMAVFAYSAGTSIVKSLVLQFENQALVCELSDARDKLSVRVEQLSARFESVIQNSPAATFLTDLEGRLQIVNRRFADWYGIAERDAVGKAFHEVFPAGVAEEQLVQERAVIEHQAPVEREQETVFADGSHHPTIVTKFPVFDSASELVGVGTVTIDITERKRIEDALRKSERINREIAELIPAAFIIECGDKVVYANALADRMFCDGEGSTLIGREALSIIDPADRESISARRDAVQATGRPSEMEQSRHRTERGTLLDTRSIVGPFVWEGEPATISIIVDQTEYLWMEAALRQSQKMEAVGQLTGGVAHDFNNLLTVILGNIEMLPVATEAERPEMIDSIYQAAERGAELTQRLLAFSRRQALRSEAIDLGELTLGMNDLLVRTLGATIDVEIVTAPGLWPAFADRGHVENALLNLAINARDAMKDGGRLTLHCYNDRLDEAYAAEHAEAIAGEYAVVAVGDTGTGMSAEVREHAFEPFFTTKEVGEGSGLGLSMVYGFARQSGGHVSIYSEEGIGTTVKLYLPRARTDAATERVVPTPDVPRGRGERILVIEDDPAVRRLAVRLLDSLGYRVKEVGDAAAARALLGGGEPIDLVLSDVILPGGMSGPQLAQQIAPHFPGLRIVFMSGYPAEAAEHKGLLHPGSILITKPFQLESLAKAIRGALD